MKLVIGFLGFPLAGKGTAADIITGLLQKDGYSVSRHRFSDILRETLTAWGIPHGRDNEQILAQLMTAPGNFKEGALSRATKARLLKDTADVGLLDGVRWYSDEAMIREFPKEGVKSILVYVTADADRRYERLIKRNRAGEAATSREKFDEQNKAQNESYTTDIGSRAEIVLENNYEQTSDFERDVQKAYEASVKPLLK